MTSHGTISSTRFRKTANYKLPSKDSSEDSGGFCHFISTPMDEQRFTLDGVRFDPSDPRQWERAESLMKRLAHLIRFNPDENKEKPNPNLPSGYTYFLQIVAHDLVHSAISTSLGEGQTFGLSNLRDTPLRLETVYGGGPTECPHAYEADRVAFRSKLRLGNSRIDASDQNHQGLGKDIARGTASTATELAQRAGYAEALIADPRNDSHAIISQMLVLFHELHNRIVDELVRGGNLPPTANSYADAQRLFMAARSACILIYRNLIRHDLLPRILHRDVWKAYETDQKPFRPLVRGEWRAPLEFTNGFFRFGHSMIRQAYRFNARAPVAFDVEQILDRTSDKSPSDVPLEAAWLVDWDLFFTEDPDAGNVSTRIGPWSQVGIGEDVPGEGNLIVRDLLSSIAIQPWSVGHLVDRLRETHGPLLEKSEFLKGLPGSRPWAGPIADWLAERSGPEETFGEDNRLSCKEIKTLAHDPPIPFFVRFEAGLDSGNNGERLGILGSIVVADVIYGVLRHDRLLPGDPVDGLQSELASLSAAMLVDTKDRGRNIFAFLADIEGPERKISLTTIRQFLDNRQRINPASQSRTGNRRRAMTFPRINVRNARDNHVRWGKLVKTWSTGKNYVRHVITEAAPFPTTVEANPEFPKPTSFREFVAQAQAAGVELFFDDGVNDRDVTGREDIGFQIIEVSPDTHFVKLPPKDKIEESEARLQRQGAVYGLPAFYERIHGTLPLPEETTSQSQKAALHAERVGEYTINTCG